MRTPLQQLQHYWKHDAFRPNQQEIIDSVMSGVDTLALLPTGGGKSVCYQVPALCMEGICIVVSPLIALMKDQVSILNKRGIKAACLYSNLKFNEQAIVLNKSISGGLKLLYVSPERLQSRMFIEHFRQMKVSFIAVDEAHCISQWGYDFRPSYLKVAEIRQYQPQAPVLALTATATPTVVEDICKRLLFRKGYRLFQSSFARENLSYVVFRESDKVGRMLKVLRGAPGSAVVYVRSRKRSVEVARFLNAHGMAAVYYHAGMSPKERDGNQLRWMNREVDVIVATNAFGMGIDKSDVRVVIHLDIPPSIEAYFQEAGRAGRDGRRSYAVLLYNEQDLQSLDSSFDIEFPSLQYIRNTYRAVCNFYNVPIGSGEGSHFDLKLLEMARTYNMQPLEFYNALRFVEREGLISMPTLDQAASKLYIPIAPDVLYRFQVENQRYGDLMGVVLRTYGGLYTDYVAIDEMVLARKNYMQKDMVVKMLLHLDALGIVSYEPAPTAPQICFSSPRIAAEDLYLSEENYAMLKQMAFQRLSAMKEYVQNRSLCRSSMLLSYFGESAQHSCGCCDVCLDRNRPSSVSVEQRVLALVSQGPRSITALMQQLMADGGTMHQESVVAVVRNLLDQGRLRQDSDMNLRLP